MGHMISLLTYLLTTSVSGLVPGYPSYYPTGTRVINYPDTAALGTGPPVPVLMHERLVVDVMDDLFNYYNPATRSITPMISQAVHDVIVKHADRFNSAIIYDRDYLYNYFGFKASVDNNKLVLIIVIIVNNTTVYIVV